jgi:hypothetical protein
MTAVGVQAAGAARKPVSAVDHHGRRWRVLVTVAIAQLTVVLDNTIVNIALPSARPGVQ